MTGPSYLGYTQWAAAIEPDRVPSLKAIRKRIQSVQSTQKITRAMKMVAGARLNKAQIRITADGKLRTCLFSKEDHDLRSHLRNGASDAGLAAYIQSVVMEKEEGHRINEPDFAPPRMYSETPAQLVAHLAHPNGWWRDTAQRLLVVAVSAYAKVNPFRLLAKLERTIIVSVTTTSSAVSLPVQMHRGEPRAD